MRIILYLLALSIAIASTASAQKFSPGYYIQTSGDTVKRDLSLQMKQGYIDKVVTPEGLFLAPKDLLGFGLNNANYIVRKVSMDKTPHSGFVIDTVFLEVMNRGKISLLYILDEDDKVHFYIENENGPQELTVRLSDKDDGVVVRKTETYKSALKGIFPTCTDLFSAIDKTVFSRKGIHAIYEKLYKCRYQEAAPAMKKEENVKVWELGVYGGVTMTNHTFVIKRNSPNIEVAIFSGLKLDKPSPLATGSVYFEMKFTRRRTLSLRHEVSYLRFEQATEQQKISRYSPISYKAALGAGYLRYTLAMRGYLLPGRAVRPFLGAGFSPMTIISKSHELTKENSDTSTSTTTPIFTKGTANAAFAYFYGVGVAYKRFALEFRSEAFKGYSDILLWKIKSYSFTLNYTIKTFEK